MHDERKDREHRPDPEAGDEHPRPEDRERRVRSEVRKEEQTDRERDGCAEREQLVPAGARDDLAGRHRADDESAEQRQDLVTRLRCARPANDLEPARKEHDRGEERHRGEEHRDHRDREGPGPEETERNDRLRCARLDPYEDRCDREPEDDEAAHRGIAPIAGLLVGQSDEDRHEGRREHGRTEVVDTRPSACRPERRHHAPDDREHDRAEREVHEEHPVPADGVGDDATDGGTDNRAEPEDRADEALVLTALACVEHVTDDRERDWEERSRTQALDRAEGDELPHLLRETGEQRPDEEYGHGEKEDRAPTEEV